MLDSDQSNAAQTDWCRSQFVSGGGGVLGMWGAGGGVVVSEFSGAWGKREEGGGRRERVELPDSLMDEAVLQSAGPRLETPQSPP